MSGDGTNGRGWGEDSKGMASGSEPLLGLRVVVGQLEGVDNLKEGLGGVEDLALEEGDHQDQDECSRMRTRMSIG